MAQTVPALTNIVNLIDAPWFSTEWVSQVLLEDYANLLLEDVMGRA